MRFLPGMNHTVGWSPRPTRERLRRARAPLGHLLLMLRMKCWPLKCFFLTTRWELHGAAIAANQLTWGQQNDYVLFALVLMTFLPKAAASFYQICLELSCPSIFDTIEGIFKIPVQICKYHHLGQETWLLLSGCHTAKGVDWVFSSCNVASHCWHGTQRIFVERNVHELWRGLALCGRLDRKSLWLNIGSGTSHSGWKRMKRGQKPIWERTDTNISKTTIPPGLLN